VNVDEPPSVWWSPSTGLVQYWNQESEHWIVMPGADLPGDAVRLVPMQDPAPIDWPARFRRAAEVMRAQDWDDMETRLRAVADEMERWMDSDEIAAVGRALLGEES
jgi:hypothetical protein